MLVFPLGWITAGPCFQGGMRNLCHLQREQKVADWLLTNSKQLRLYFSVEFCIVSILHISLSSLINPS